MSKDQILVSTCARCGHEHRILVSTVTSDVHRIIQDTIQTVLLITYLSRLPYKCFISTLDTAKEVFRVSLDSNWVQTTTVEIKCFLHVVAVSSEQSILISYRVIKHAILGNENRMLKISWYMTEIANSCVIFSHSLWYSCQQSMFIQFFAMIACWILNQSCHSTCNDLWSLLHVLKEMYAPWNSPACEHEDIIVIVFYEAFENRSRFKYSVQ